MCGTPWQCYCRLLIRETRAGVASKQAVLGVRLYPLPRAMISAPPAHGAPLWQHDVLQGQCQPCSAREWAVMGRSCGARAVGTEAGDGPALLPALRHNKSLFQYPLVSSSISLLPTSGSIQRRWMNDVGAVIYQLWV